MSSNIKLSENITFPYQENGYAHKCFPVRNIRRFKPDDGGAWLVEYKAEKERQLGTLHPTNNVSKKKVSKVQKKFKEFTASFLTKEFHLDDPSGLFSINVNGKQLQSVKHENFNLFGNVLYIEAGDNQLNFETFKSFPRLEELHLQVNGISNIIITHKQFECLKRLDLSYNCLTDDALLNLGKLRNIKELTLRGCSLKCLPPELARAYLAFDTDEDEKNSKAEKKSRFPELEHLDLSENKLTDLSTFASLAGLRKLKTLNLSSNKICGVPHLRSIVSQRHFSASTCTCKSALDDVTLLPNPLARQNSIENVTKAKEFCEIEGAGIDVVAPINVIVDENDTKTDVAEEGNIVLTESENKNDNDTVDPISQDDNSVESTVAHDSCDTDISEKDKTSDSAKESDDSDISDDEENIDDSIDMAKDIDFNDICSFNSEIVEKALDEVSNVNMSPVTNINVINSCKDVKEAEKDIDIDLAEENFTVEVTDVKDSSKVNGSVKTNSPTDGGTSRLSGNNLQESIDIGMLNDEYAKVMGMESGGVDDGTLPNDLAKEINFALCTHSDSTTSGDDVIDSNFKNPFPLLKMLDVSNNVIAEEEALLALTSWPILQDLKLWGNPLMQSYKGVPPIISHHLQKMCGITVHRKAPQSDHIYYPIGPSIAKSAKTFRVKNDLPPIKRNTMLMIEAEIRKAVEDSDRKEKGLPPIDTEGGDEESEKDTLNEDLVDDNEAEGIFLTQVDEDIEVPKPEKAVTPKQKAEEEVEVDSIYKGYEELLKIDETYGPESDILIPPTVTGSVQALRHMLKNPLVFKEGNYNRKSRLNPEEQKKKTRRVPAVKKKDDVIEDALEFIRTKETTYQENLANVLDQFGKNSEMKEKFPDAKKIVKRVQEKYDKVRLESLRPISAAQAELSRMSTRADKHSQDLILLRMKQGRIGDLYSARNTSIPRSRASARSGSRTAP